jgi:hypothetical protein
VGRNILYTKLRTGPRLLGHLSDLFEPRTLESHARPALRKAEQVAELASAWTVVDTTFILYP